ncbi:serine/threonine protein phosphatase PrpC [Azospirillum agricola]|uniref:bifunctional protein-serine/threonine kinase/phosphatase n=1 Tax=Azospirillum agricola TaxID=1720247 RepID=UPI001F1E2462|nr:bifunctional protein-serine/threonine kinase/phosphatase [Azospirillum agricola]MBP2231207.1 serine/threonine protein phosphatase PrpC [Azospirillum agricola]
MNGSLQVQFGIASDTGRRPRNEDYAGVCLASPGRRVRQGIVAALADGVGGAKGGRIAAELAVRTFIDGYYAQPEPLGVQRAAARVIEAVNRWIVAQGRADPALENMASTFAGLILRHRNAHVLHVGDSRVYRLSDGQLARLTEDHTLNRPDYAHVLYRGLGIEEAVRLDYGVHPLRLHDRFLLCSDGVHGTLTDVALRSLLMRRDTPEAAARLIVDTALDAGSSDNASAVVVDVVGLPAIEHTELESAAANLPILAPPAAGEELDGFRLDAPLSDGRYSRLFRATNLEDGRSVVIKFPQPEVAADKTFRLAFVREAWVAARVRSPWVGEVIELPPGRQTRLYTVMPYYEGETLEQRLRRKPSLALAEGVEIAVTLARALSALHRAGIIHRDIKPDNVILGRGGRLTLIDLGVARLPQLEEFPTADVPGTPSYMAPELFAGSAGDERSDQFALAVTIHRALSGGGYPYGEVEPFSRPRFGKPVPLARGRGDVPAWFDQILARALSPAPADRFGDVIEFAQELENALAHGRPEIVRRRPLYERNPVLVWQCVSAALLCAMLALLARG